MCKCFNKCLQHTLKTNEKEHLIKEVRAVKKKQMKILELKNVITPIFKILMNQLSRKIKMIEETIKEFENTIIEIT